MPRALPVRPSLVNRRGGSLGSSSSIRFDAIRSSRVDARERIRPLVISESFFNSVLVRELRRSDRSNLPSAVVLVSLRDDADTTPVSDIAWRPIIDALNASKRETDIIGWFKQGAAVGVILPELRASEMAVVRDFGARVRTELLKRLTPDAVDQVIVRFHVSPAPSQTDGIAELSIDPLPIDLRARPTHVAKYDQLKRALDAAGSALLLAALAPVMLVVAALVKLTSNGPIFFRQPRIGQMGRSFTMLKFRTMKVDADHALHQKFVTEFINSAPKVQAKSDAPFKIANDPRVTPLGRVLRKTSLDELPQLWNVLIGDMSLVGPRPPIAYEVAQYKLWHNRRLFEAKPGVTGLWQVAGRSRTTFDEMVRLDLRYAKSRSLWTDLKILVATPAAVFTGKGAC